MIPIDRPGAFRGLPLEWVVNTSRNGYPQFVVRLQATEHYDEESQTWMPWVQYDMEITAYLILFYEKGGKMVPCFQHENCERAFGWAEPFAFSALHDGDWSNTTILFRVEDSEYQGTHKLKVVSIDAHNGDPLRGGGNIQPLEPGKLAALDADPRYKRTSSKAPPKRVAPGFPTPPPKAAAPDPTPVSGAAETSATAAPPAEAEPGTTPPAAPPSPNQPKPKTKPKKSKSKAESKPGEMTKIEAWGKVHEFKTAEVTDDDVTKAWLASVKKVCPDKQEPDITPAEWATICGETLDQIDYIPF